MLSNSQTGLQFLEIDIQLSSLVQYNVMQGTSPQTPSSENYHDDQYESGSKEFAVHNNTKHGMPNERVEARKNENVATEQPQSVLESQSLDAYVDEWTDDLDDIDDLFQSDFNHVIAGHDELVLSSQFDDLLLPCVQPASQLGAPLYSSLQQRLSNTSCQLSKTTKKPVSDVVATPGQIEACSSVERPRKRKISSESVDTHESDEDSQHSENHILSQEAIVEFAWDLIEKDKQHCKTFFWQYNTQSRGPKSQRLCHKIENEDSHVVADFADPVFESSHDICSWKHNGRARNGDGNDLNPDPMKLLMIGLQIRSLEAEYHLIKASSEGDEDTSLRISASNASKQKNKLASRICRLKKKAMHAANKIKLDGLKQEHGQLMEVMKCLVARIKEYLVTRSPLGASCRQTLEEYIKKHLTFMIAGHTTEYVNTELEKIAHKLITEN